MRMVAMGTLVKITEREILHPGWWGEGQRHGILWILLRPTELCPSWT